MSEVDSNRGTPLSSPHVIIPCTSNDAYDHLVIDTMPYGNILLKFFKSQNEVKTQRLQVPNLDVCTHRDFRHVTVCARNFLLAHLVEALTLWEIYAAEDVQSDNGQFKYPQVVFKDVTISEVCGGVMGFWIPKQRKVQFYSIISGSTASLPLNETVKKIMPTVDGNEISWKIVTNRENKLVVLVEINGVLLIKRYSEILLE